MKNTSLIIITVGNKFLMFKRAVDGEMFGGQYGLAGGGQEEGETNLECLKRECTEEIGIIPNNIKFLQSYKFGDRQLNIFSGELSNLDGIKLNKEHTESKLFSPEEINNPGIIKTTPKFIERYFEELGPSISSE